MEKIFQKVYDSEINFEISCFFDTGFKIRLGDKVNGFKGECEVENWSEISKALHNLIIKHLPDSEYSKKYKEVENE